MARITDKQETRNRLLDRGVQLLTEQGYHGTGLQDLLEGMGVPKGSFYNYFENKEAFGAEAIGHYIEPFIQRLRYYLDQPDLGGREALEAYFGELIAELQYRQFQGGCLLGNLLGEIGDTSPICREALSRAFHRYRDQLAEGIGRGQREGTYRRDKTAVELADRLADAWQGALLRMKVEQSVQPLEACCKSLLGEYFRIDSAMAE